MSKRPLLDFYVWKEIHKLPYLVIQLWQKNKIKKLLNHAHRNIPFYVEHWKKGGIYDIGGPTLENFNQLPIVDKKDFIASSPEKYQYIKSSIDNYVWPKTSGSTGTPFRFVMPRYGPAGIEPPYEDYHSWRFLEWRGFSLKQILYSLRILEFRVSRSSNRYLRPFINIEELQNEDSLLVKLKEYGKTCSIIGSYSSVLYELARVVKKNKWQIQFDYAVGYGDMLLDTQRRYIEEVLGCEIYDQYANEEFWVVATECKKHDGMHIHSESFLVEVTDDRGCEVKHGEKGNIVITSFFNYAMPFIRYKIGDLGRVIDKKCSCGLATPRLVLEGRDGYFLEFENVTIHYYQIIKIILENSTAIYQYQIVKTGFNELELLIVPSDAWQGLVGKKILKDLKKILRDGVHIKLVLVKKIKPNSNGKQKICIDLTKTQN